MMAESPQLSSASVCSHWHVVAETDEVSPGPMGVTQLGEDLAVWRDPDGSLVAAPDRCPHREAPLSAGTVEEGCLACVYHRLDLRGLGALCRRPVGLWRRSSAATGESPHHRCCREARAGLAVSRRTCRFDLRNGGRCRPVVPADQHWRRRLEGVCSPDGRQLPRHLHFPCVHRGTFGGPGATGAVYRPGGP